MKLDLGTYFVMRDTSHSRSMNDVYVVWHTIAQSSD